MTITATRTPTNLAWSNFVSTPNLIDPADGQPMDAFTAFNYAFPGLPPQTINGQIALAATFQITITPNCKVRPGSPQTAPLLAHEQFHYDVGFVIARRVAKEFMALRGIDKPDLITKLNAVIDLHFSRRAGLIQRRYDIDTVHGTVARYQTQYLQMMTTCLANPNATMIGGWWL